MFVLYTSNRTEALAEQLASVISESGGQSLFARALFLVQSREMERMLSQFLADRFGVWGNSKYLLPLQFVEYICQVLGVEHHSDAFDRSILTWRLELLLRQVDDPALKPLISYLSGEHSDLKRYQFARQIAHLFDQYQIMRPELIRAWDHGRRTTGNKSEGWQLHLWRKLRQTTSGHHRGEAINLLIEHLQARPQDLPKELRRVFVFGLHTLPPQFLRILNALSEGADIHFFLLAPTALYWGDMETRRSTIRHGVDDALWTGAAAFHPLLTGLGRQGADFQELLIDQVTQMVEGPELFAGHDNKEELTLLQRLQNDLLAGCEDEADSAVLAPGGDDSVVIVSCHSRMREISVLRDYILKWLEDDPALNLHDIVVMAPDIQRYADLIPALFKDVAHDISDCRKRRDNRYVEIFSQFLDLFSGRFSGPEIVSLLDQPEVRNTFGIGAADLDTIKYWLEDVGVRWGLSGKQKQQDGLADFSAGTWSDGLERMLLGLASGSSDPVDTLIPYIDIEGGDAELLGSLCSFIELVSSCRGTTNAAHTLLGWSMVLQEMSSQLFDAADSADFLNLQEMLAGLAERAGDHHDESISFEVIRQWFQYEAETTSSVDFLRGRLTFCSMLPMRSIPFSIICLLGLNDGEFPKQDRFLPFNLLTERYEKGDRSQRADDRYQFLEAILAARRRLYLSYIGQSIRTNEPIPPSPVVSELIEAIRHRRGSIAVVNHPLQPFDVSYFSPDTELFSHNYYYCATAQSFLDPPERLTGPWFLNQVEPGLDDRVHLTDLMSFVSNPQRFFVRQVLNMVLRTEVELLDDSETFVLDGLERYLASQNLVEALLGGNNPEHLFEELQQKQVWPQGNPGRLQFEQLHDELDDFVSRVRAVGFGDRLDNIDFDLALGPTQLSGVLTNRWEAGQLLYRYGGLKGRDLLQGWVLHLAAGVIGERCGPTRIVLKDATVTIDSDWGDDNDLMRVVDLFINGCRQSSKLYVEAAYTLCRQEILNRSRGRSEPRAKAVQMLDHQIGKGYAEELSILFTEPRAEELLDHEFVALCEEFLLPLMERMEIVTDT